MFAGASRNLYSYCIHYIIFKCIDTYIHTFVRAQVLIADLYDRPRAIFDSENYNR